MKKLLSCLMVIALLLSLASCGVSRPTWQEHYDAGCRYLYEGAYSDAIIAFSSAIELDNTQPQAYLGRADAYCLSGDDENTYRAALADYAQAISLDSTCTAAYMGLVNLYLVNGDTDMAKSVLDEGMTLCPTPELEEMQQELTAQTASVSVTVTPMDHSLYTDDGKGKIELIFHLPELSGGDAAAVEAINLFLQTEYQNYQDELSGMDLTDTLSYVGEGTFFYNIYCQETFNNGQYLSLCFGTDWMMGGVYNYIPYGYTFDLTTGQRVTPDALFAQDSDALLNEIKHCIYQHLTDNNLYGTAMDAQMQDEVISSYTLDTLSYYLDENGELIICIPEYELASGAAGSLTVFTGMILNPQP